MKCVAPSSQPHAQSRNLYTHWLAASSSSDRPSNTSSVRVSPEPTAPEPVAASGQEEGTMVTLTEPISEDHAPYKEKKQNKKMLAVRAAVCCEFHLMPLSPWHRDH